MRSGTPVHYKCDCCKEETTPDVWVIQLCTPWKDFTLDVCKECANSASAMHILFDDMKDKTLTAKAEYNAD